MKRLMLGCMLLCGCNGQSATDQTVATDVPTAAATGVAGTAPAGPPMKSISELTLPGDVDTEVRGAHIEDPAKWPASFYSQSAGGFCTSTLVGDRVLLTAAHCVANGAVVTLERNGQPYRAVCEHAPQYDPASESGRTADYALCAVNQSIPNVLYEWVNRDPSVLKLGQSLLLTGFGCTRDDGSGGNDGLYRAGDDDRIVGLPQPPTNDITIEGETGLCFGDSGGPAFLVNGNRRIQVSVNSRVQNMVQGGTNLGPRSYLSSTSTPAAVAFFQDWAKRNRLRICLSPKPGNEPDVPGCR